MLNPFFLKESDAKRLMAHTRGFSLVEMLVVVSIFVILSGIVIVSFGDFNNKTFVANGAYQLALSIREAQTYSRSVRAQIDAPATFQNGYGIAISLATRPASSYFLFADKPSGVGGLPDHRYTDSNENVSRTDFPQDTVISKFCVAYGGAAKVCTGPASNPQRTIDISFLRPNFDAIIRSYVDAYAADADYAELYVAAEGNAPQHIVRVRKSGDVGVEPCPVATNNQCTNP